MSTNVTYGDITIQNCQTERFSQTCHYDESNTDLLYHEFDIEVSGTVVLGASGGFHGVIANGSDAVEIMSDIQNRMMHPRQPFVYSMDGKPLLQASPDHANPLVDVDNGPKPLNCSITHIASNKVFRIRFAIKVCIVLCADERQDYLLGQTVSVSKSPDWVLSNRWSLTETKDANFYTTRTWSGVVRVKHSAWNPNWARWLCLPHQTRGYRRQRMNWHATPDGLNLRYDITDVQEYQSPPFPATKMSGTYTEAIGPGGKLGVARVQVMLEGPPDAHKADLIVRAAEVCIDRLGSITEGTEVFSKPALVQGAITEHLGRNRIEMSLEYKRAPRDKDYGVDRYSNIIVRTMGTPLTLRNYDEKVFPGTGPFDGKTPAGVFVMYLQSPCGSWHGMPNPAPTPAEYVDPSPIYDDNHQPDQNYYLDYGLPADPPQEGYSEDHANYYYEHWVMSQRYLIDRGKAQLAIADDDAQAADPSSVVVTLHRPTAQRIVHAHGIRIGDWPEMPNADDMNDPNGIAETCLSEDILVQNRELMADGKTFQYELEVEYTYALSRAPTAQERLRGGSDPADIGLPGDGMFPLNRRTSGRLE